MTPSESYQDAVRDGFQPDAAQAAAAAELTRVYQALLIRPAPKTASLFGKLRGLVVDEQPATVRGLYLWGGVGRGKTWLMNTFHDSLPFQNKLREHFHAFMRRIHLELKSLPNTVDPLNTVAERLAAETRIINLDEFHVADIADAMLLGRLLEALFERGITVVTTSNTQPDELYKDGLQRARFLPAIELIKKNMVVYELSSDVDYRLRALERAEIYHSPLDERAEQSLEECFEALSPQNLHEAQTLDVLGRPVRTRRTADGIAWFEFSELCDTPRAAADYIELARSFHTVLVANIPMMIGPLDDNKAQRFIQLVDEFYDRNVNLIVSAAGEPAELYAEGRLAAPFLRTRSRLEEMRSREYLSRLHLP